MGGEDFRQFMGLRNQLVKAAENFSREEIVTPVLRPTMCKDMEEQFNLSHKLNDVVDRANRKICVTLLWYNVDKPDSCYAQVEDLQGRRRTRSFNKLSMWIMNLKNLSIYLM